MPTCANMCHSVPTWANIAVCQLCRERQPFWNSHDGLNLTCLDQCLVVRSHGTSSSQGWHKRIVIQQSEFDPWVHIFIFAEGDCCRFAFVNISVCLCLRKQQPRFAQGQPKGYFQTKELDRTTEAFARMNVVWKVEKAERAEFNVPTWANIAVCQPCRERQPVWNCHDGLNLTCLDQCHGVRSHGTSSSQGWRQRIVVKSTV